MGESVLLNNEEVNSIIHELSEKVYNDISDIDNFAIIGVQTRGVEIANRIRKNIENLSGNSIKSGVLDITFHRDDIATRGVLPVIKETRVEFDITKMTILLVDDVIFTGRTVKAALETLTTFGRPRRIKFFVLVDRGNRELPIQPDYCGLTIDTEINDNIKVLLKEIDNVDDAVLMVKDESSQ